MGALSHSYVGSTSVLPDEAYDKLNSLLHPVILINSKANFVFF